MAWLDNIGLSYLWGKIKSYVDTKVGSHANNKSNPHGVTAEQVGALPITGGNLSGGLSVGNKLIQGKPSADASISSMNRFEDDLFIVGSGAAPNNPRVPGFYLGKSETDENRHIDIVSGDTYSYIDFNKASRESDYDVRLLVNVDTGESQYMWGPDAALSNKILNVGGTIMQHGSPVALQYKIPTKASDIGAQPAGSYAPSSVKDTVDGFKSALWSGTWNSGAITVPNTANYTLFKIVMDGQGTAILAMKHGSYIRGIGGYSSATPSIITYQFAATFSDNTWTFVACNALTHTKSGSHSEITNLNVVGIEGII